MDYKKILKFYFLIISFFCLICFIGCSEKEKNTTENTFYVELVNFTNDSLKQSTSQNIFGKVSYYQNDKLQILSLNYVNEEFTKLHYYKSVDELKKEVKTDTKKIRIEFGGVYTPDSISYSLQKFIYRNKQWVKISDMGYVKSTNTYYREKQFAIKEYGVKIMNNVAIYTYD